MVSNSSPLLINESPLQVLPSLAVALGNINEAIILQQIQYWLKNPKSGRLDDQGHKYIRDTVSEWNAQFPWLTERAIKTRLKSLKDKGIILTANLNKSKYDRTNWYSIDYDALNKLMQMHSEETSPSEGKKVHDQKGRNFPIKSEETSQPIPKTSTKTSSETSTNKNSASKDAPRIPYKEVIDYLNQKTGAHYKPSSKANQRLIKARFKEGYKLDDFKTVIDNKAFDWQGTPYWKYMRPSTLFGASKFDGYLNANNLNQTRNTPASGGYGGTVDISSIPDD
ncbi:conserved phage C-terminal domain-containing protein, partial [Lactobacillus xujianguonis]